MINGVMMGLKLVAAFALIGIFLVVAYTAKRVREAGEAEVERQVDLSEKHR